jgi:hypothetical protein
MTSITGNVIDWWRRRRWNAARINKIHTYPSAAALPAQLGRHVLAIAGDPAAWAVMECPCGNGHRLQVRVRPHGNAAVWDVQENDRGPSLYPSVDFDSAERRCHFWLDQGRVRWVRD